MMKHKICKINEKNWQKDLLNLKNAMIQRKCKVNKNIHTKF